MVSQPHWFRAIGETKRRLSDCFNKHRRTVDNDKPTALNPLQYQNIFLFVFIIYNLFCTMFKYRQEETDISLKLHTSPKSGAHTTVLLTPFIVQIYRYFAPYTNGVQFLNCCRHPRLQKFPPSVGGFECNSIELSNNNWMILYFWQGFNLQTDDFLSRCRVIFLFSLLCTYTCLWKLQKGT